MQPGGGREGGGARVQKDLVSAGAQVEGPGQRAGGWTGGEHLPGSHALQCNRKYKYLVRVIYLIYIWSIFGLYLIYV